MVEIGAGACLDRRGSNAMKRVTVGPESLRRNRAGLLWPRWKKKKNPAVTDARCLARQD